MQKDNNKIKALVKVFHTFISPAKKYIEAPLWNFLKQKKKGSITIEAAAVCSLAIITISTFIFFFQILEKEFQLKQDMYQKQKYRVFLEKSDKEPEEYVEYAWVQLWGTNRVVLISNRLMNYGFDGYGGELISETIYVYVTKNGTVYHKKLTCPHLNINIMAVSPQEIITKRNSSGGKYYPCEICGIKTEENIYYITDHGNKYHGKKDCGSLLRMIEKVPLSETEHLEVCKDCGE